MMRTLIAKDRRLLRPVLVFAGVLLALPTLIIVTGWLVLSGAASQPAQAFMNWQERLQAFIYTIGLGMVAASAVTPALFETLAARERRDRSAEYLEMLAVPRWRTVLSKVIVGIWGLALPWIVGLALWAIIGLVLTATGTLVHFY